MAENYVCLGDNAYELCSIRGAGCEAIPTKTMEISTYKKLSVRHPIRGKLVDLVIIGHCIKLSRTIFESETVLLQSRRCFRSELDLPFCQMQ